MGCRPTQKGWFCLTLFIISIITLIVAFVFQGMVEPNGELGLYYAVPSCRSSSTDIAGRGVFNMYTMRPFTTTVDSDTTLPEEDITRDED